MHGRWRDAERSHFFGLEPDPHRKGALAQYVGALNAVDRAQLGLHNARQIVRNLVLIEIGGREAQIHRRKLRVRGLQIDHRRLGFRRQVVADLRYLCLNLRERSVGVVVEL